MILKFFKPAVVIYLICFLALPSTVFSAQGKNKNIVSFIPFHQNQKSSEMQVAKELSASLSRVFHAKVNVVSKDLLLQSARYTNIKDLQSEYLGLYHKILESKQLYSLGGDAKGALGGLESVGREILKVTDYSKGLSKLYETVILNQAWILFQTKRKSDASQKIQSALMGRELKSLNLKGFPSGFRRFAKHSLKSKQVQTRSLKIKSSPSSTDVFVDGIYIGDSSKELMVPVGKHHIFISSAGRKTYKKLVKGDQNITLNVKLRWMGANQRARKGGVQHNVIDQLAYTSSLNRSIHADKIVIVYVEKTPKGHQVYAKVFDEKYHQPLSTLKYPRLVKSFKQESLRVKNYYVSKLRPYLTKSAGHLWKKDFDSTIMLDQRLAMRPKKPLYQKPSFWIGVGAIVVGGVVTGLALSHSNSSSSSPSGSINIDLDGFRGARK